MIFNFINWTVDPIFVDLGFREVRWYGVLFGLGFYIGFILLKRVFNQEKIDLKHLDSLTIWMIISTLIGARLGDVFFYNWEFYSQNPGEIIKIWNGGLASHGAGIAILASIFVYSRIHKDTFSYLGLMDRLTPAIAFGCFSIRMGNLMNHEIVGKPTDVPWAFKFSLIDELPRHPAQLYEAIGYLFICILLYKLFFKFKEKTPVGLLLGISLFLAFILRFLIEFIKEDQVINEQDIVFIHGLNQGQNLSIPFILAGLLLIINALRNKNIHNNTFLKPKSND